MPLVLSAIAPFTCCHGCIWFSYLAENCLLQNCGPLDFQYLLASFISKYIQLGHIYLGLNSQAISSGVFKHSPKYGSSCLSSPLPFLLGDQGCVWALYSGHSLASPTLINTQSNRVSNKGSTTNLLCLVCLYLILPGQEVWGKTETSLPAAMIFTYWEGDFCDH